MDTGTVGGGEVIAGWVGRVLLRRGNGDRKRASLCRSVAGFPAKFIPNGGQGVLDEAER